MARRRRPMRPGDDVLVLGAGLTGLSAAHALSRAGVGVKVLEREPDVGGLARTVASGPFRFDLGGHRFFTHDAVVLGLVRRLLGPECLTVSRRSQIFLRDRYVDYPLRPWNAVSGLGVPTALRIVLDRAGEKLRGRAGSRPMVSLEDWVVGHFGRTLFEIYFKEYSEKVWGIACRDISMDWMAQRIQGLSLGAALKNAFLGRGGGEIRTLADSFLYPQSGIGRIAERLREEIEERNEVRCGVEVRRVRHRDFRVEAVVLGGQAPAAEARAVVSTLPVTDLVRMLDPAPPGEVLRAAGSLRFRDLVLVAVMLDRPRSTGQTWLYFPERKIPFGRIHEPTNWSPWMAPEGKTLLVAERFCFRGDDTWRSSDGELAESTVGQLQRLGIVSREEVLGSAVVRVPRAYPLFEVGYREHLETVGAYLGRFRNLFPAGRGGTFSYLNMDHAMAAGMEAAAKVLAGGARASDGREVDPLPARRIA